MNLEPESTLARIVMYASPSEPVTIGPYGVYALA